MIQRVTDEQARAMSKPGSWACKLDAIDLASDLIDARDTIRVMKEERAVLCEQRDEYAAREHVALVDLARVTADARAQVRALVEERDDLKGAVVSMRIHPNGPVVAQRQRRALVRCGAMIRDLGRKNDALWLGCEAAKVVRMDRDRALARVADLERALARLLVRVEGAIACGSWDYAFDHACSECAPGGEIVIPGFRCALHAARALAASHEPGAEPAPRRAVRCEVCGHPWSSHFNDGECRECSDDHIYAPAQPAKEER